MTKVDRRSYSILGCLTRRGLFCAVTASIAFGGHGGLRAFACRLSPIPEPSRRLWLAFVMECFQQRCCIPLCSAMLVSLVCRLPPLFLYCLSALPPFLLRGLVLHRCCPNVAKPCTVCTAKATNLERCPCSAYSEAAQATNALSVHAGRRFYAIVYAETLAEVYPIACLGACRLWRLLRARAPHAPHGRMHTRRTAHSAATLAATALSFTTES